MGTTTRQADGMSPHWCTLCRHRSSDYGLCECRCHKDQAGLGGARSGKPECGQPWPGRVRPGEARQAQGEVTPQGIAPAVVMIDTTCAAGSTCPSIRSRS